MRSRVKRDHLSYNFQIEVVDLRKEIIEEPKDESTPESKVLETYSVFESAHFVTGISQLCLVFGSFFKLF